MLVTLDNELKSRIQKVHIRVTYRELSLLVSHWVLPMKRPALLLGEYRANSWDQHDDPWLTNGTYRFESRVRGFFPFSVDWFFGRHVEGVFDLTL